MKIIQLKKFGKVLISRPAGLEAFNAVRPDIKQEDVVQVDFDGVLTVTPSWFDEFLTNLAEYQKGKVELLPTKNASVLAILPVLVIDREDYASAVINDFLKKHDITS